MLMNERSFTPALQPEAVTGEQLHDKRIAAIPDVEVFADEKFFSEKPRPLVGLEYTLVGSDAAELVGIDKQTGYPRETLLDDRTGEPGWINSPEFVNLKETTEVDLRDAQIIDLQKKAAKKLSELGIYGHSITSSSGSTHELLINLYNVMKFGLWPEYNKEVSQYNDAPWLGSFETLNGSSLHGTTAGEFFHSFAVIPKNSSDEFVAIPEEYGGGSFVPALEQLIVVPTQSVKKQLIDLYDRADHFSDHSYSTIRTLKDNIVTYEEIVLGRVPGVGSGIERIDVSDLITNKHS